MNKILKSKYSYSNEYLRKQNISLTDFFKNLNKEDVIVINDNNLFGYIEIFKEATKMGFSKILLTYHITPEKNIIINTLSELEKLTSKIREINNSNEIQNLNKKTGILSTDKLNNLNQLLGNDIEISNKFNIVSDDELQHLKLSNISNEIFTYINSLSFDNFMPTPQHKLTKEEIIKSINIKLGYAENSNYQSIREDYAKLYINSPKENKKQIELEAKYALSLYQNYMERIDEEWETMGKFTNYLHFVSQIVTAAKNNNQMVGPGRGSAPSSLICYALNISEIDPIKYNLEFSRFFNKDRKDLPDIDIDLSAAGRDIIPNLLNDYSFMKIQTMSNVKLLTQIKNLFETKQNNEPVLNMREDLAFISEFKKLIKKIENNPQLEEQISKNFFYYIQDNYFEYINKLPKEKFNIFISKIKEIEEKINNYQGTSIHASGYIILSKEQKNKLDKITTSSFSDGWETIQMSKDALESIGVQKYDLLALSYLDIIKETKDRIKNTFLDVNLDAINIENMDNQTLKTVLSLATNGNRSLFQLDSFNIQITCMKVFNEWINNKSSDKKTLLEIVSDIIAIIRPGVVQNNIDLNYIKNFDGKNSEFLNTFKSDENIYNKLKSAFPLGNLIYQEDVMQVAKIFGVENADSFRRAVSKKNPKEMETQREIFINSALKQNNLYNKTELNNLFNTLAKYSEYCFNKSHSLSYAKILLETANLFANHPNEYLISYINKTDKFENILNIVKEATERGVNIKFENLDKKINHSYENNIVTLNLNKLPTSMKFDKIESLNLAVKIGNKIKNQNNWKSKLLSDPSAFSSKSSRLMNYLVFDNNDIPYLLKNITKQIGKFGNYYKYEFSNGKVFFDNKKLPLEINKIYDLDIINNKIINIKNFVLKQQMEINFSTIINNQNHIVTNPLNNEILQLDYFNKNGNLLINGSTNGVEYKINIQEEKVKKILPKIKQENTIQLF